MSRHGGVTLADAVEEMRAAARGEDFPAFRRSLDHIERLAAEEPDAVSAFLRTVLPAAGGAR